MRKAATARPQAKGTAARMTGRKLSAFLATTFLRALGYGSDEEAARWVATADRSAHVAGDAVDIGPSAARAWLSEHGARYGLCQIYRNESWHYELLPRAIGRGCPPMYADPTRDPRMQQ